MISDDDSATLTQIQCLLPDGGESEAEVDNYISELKERSHKRRCLEDGDMGRPGPSSQTVHAHLWRVQCKVRLIFLDCGLEA